MLKTAQEMLEMGFKFSPLTLGPRHDLPISHQALKKISSSRARMALLEVSRSGKAEEGGVSLFLLGRVEKAWEPEAEVERREEELLVCLFLDAPVRPHSLPRDNS